MRTRQVVGSSQELRDGEIRTDDWSEEITVKMFKFRHSSRVCRRNFGLRNGLNKIPENEMIELKNIVRSPVLNERPISITKLTPATKVTTSGIATAARGSADSKMVQGEKSKKSAFWKVFKLVSPEKSSTSRSDSQKAKNHHMEAATLLSFV